MFYNHQSVLRNFVKKVTFLFKKSTNVINNFTAKFISLMLLFKIYNYNKLQIKNVNDVYHVYSILFFCFSNTTVCEFRL